MNVVVPMAGRGSRFSTQGISIPKPLVEVNGRHMVAWALESLEKVDYSRIIFIALQEHEYFYGITHILKNICGQQAEVILIPDITEGQLCTVLAAKEWINTKEDFLISSSDTYCISSLERDITLRPPACHGIISVANLQGNQWSFARTDSTGKVVEVAEKNRISDFASTGLYYFTCGQEFVKIGEDMINRQEKTRGEYYVIPVYQKYIERGWRVDISIADEMWDMGTPESLEVFKNKKLNHPE